MIKCKKLQLTENPSAVQASLRHTSMEVMTIKITLAFFFFICSMWFCYNMSEYTPDYTTHTSHYTGETRKRTREKIRITRKAWPELFSHIAYLEIDCSTKDQSGLPLGQVFLLRPEIKKEVVTRSLTGESFVVDKKDSKFVFVDVHFKNYLGMTNRETLWGGTKSVLFEPITGFVDSKKTNLKEIQSRIKKVCKIGDKKNP